MISAHAIMSIGTLPVLILVSGKFLATSGSLWQKHEVTSASLQQKFGPHPAASGRANTTLPEA